MSRLPRSRAVLAFFLAFAVGAFTVDASGALAAPLETKTDASIPLPVPSDADDAAFDADAGTLDFTTAASIKDLAAFYRGEMKKRGLKEQPSVIAKETIAVLNFSDSNGPLVLTLMRMGDQTRFQAIGLHATGGQAQAGAVTGDAAPASATAPSAEEENGLPIPAGVGDNKSARTMPFRRDVGFESAMDVAALVAFYRQELGKRGWKELTDKSKVGVDRAMLAFAAPEGPGTVEIQKQSGGSHALVGVSDKAKASASPLFPKPGKVKVMLGNINDKPVDVTIGGKTVKVPAQAGRNGPDGPSVDLAPGKIEAAIKGGDKDSFTAGPDEIWMEMVGPDGSFMPAMQAF